MDYKKVAHAVNFCPFHRDLAIIFTGNNRGKPGIKKSITITGNNADRIINPAELVRYRVCSG